MVSTGLGSTAWLKSVVTGGIALARAVHGLPVQQIYQPIAWDAKQLTLASRFRSEPRRRRSYMQSP